MLEVIVTDGKFFGVLFIDDFVYYVSKLLLMEAF